MQPDEPGVGGQCDLHGDGVEDRRGDGDAVEQRADGDRTGLGDGRVGEHDGDFHGHGGDDPECSGRDHHSNAERKYTSGYDFGAGSGGSERSDVQPCEPGLGGQCDLHGDGVEDWRGDGDAIQQRSRADGTGFRDSGVREYDGDLHGHGGDDHEQPDGDHHGDAERKYTNGHDLAGGPGAAERGDVQSGELGVGGQCDLHGDGVEDGRSNGDAIEQRGGVDRAGFGGGRVEQHDGDLHRHGGDDREQPDGDHHSDAERKHGDGYDFAGAGNGPNRFSFLQPEFE